MENKLTRIVVFKGAQLRRTEKPIADVFLEITGDIEGDGPSSLQSADGFFDDQAELVMQALQALPQGTRFRVLRRLLKDVSCYYIGAGPVGSVKDEK